MFDALAGDSDPGQLGLAGALASSVKHWQVQVTPSSSQVAESAKLSSKPGRRRRRRRRRPESGSSSSHCDSDDRGTIPY